MNQDWVETAREFLSNPWVTAALIVVGSALTARIVDAVLCRAVLRLARRTKTDLDERLVLLDPVALHTHPEGALALHPGEDVDTQLAGLRVHSAATHGLHSPCGTRRRPR